MEHPVSESITGVSMPGTQLHVAMGIPLWNVPEVRPTPTPNLTPLTPNVPEVRASYDEDTLTPPSP